MTERAGLLERKPRVKVRGLAGVSGTLIAPIVREFPSPRTSFYPFKPVERFQVR
jgi:hypothetical protein